MGSATLKRGSNITNVVGTGRRRLQSRSKSTGSIAAATAIVVEIREEGKPPASRAMNESARVRQEYINEHGMAPGVTVKDGRGALHVIEYITEKTGVTAPFLLVFVNHGSYHGRPRTFSPEGFVVVAPVKTRRRASK